MEILADYGLTGVMISFSVYAILYLSKRDERHHVERIKHNQILHELVKSNTEVVAKNSIILDDVRRLI